MNLVLGSAIAANGQSFSLMWKFLIQVLAAVIGQVRVLPLLLWGRR
jgi:hypothetical protein